MRLRRARFVLGGNCSDCVDARLGGGPLARRSSRFAFPAGSSDCGCDSVGIVGQSNGSGGGSSHQKEEKNRAPKFAHHLATYR